MAESNVADRVKKIVIEHLGVDEAKVAPNAKFIDDLGADSLDTVELVMAFEEAFDIEIPDEDAEKIRTVQDAVDYIGTSAFYPLTDGNSPTVAQLKAAWTEKGYLALLENLQREDLNALDVALSFQRMKAELHYTDEEVAKRMGLDRSTVNNFTRLLKLPPAIQKSLSEGKIDRGHAIALLSLDNNENDQLKIFEEILKGPDGDYSKPLSVRKTEELVRFYKKNRTVKEAKKDQNHPEYPHYKRIEDILCSHFSTKVSLQHDFNKKKGSITISYNDIVQLNNILKQLGISAD